MITKEKSPMRVLFFRDHEISGLRPTAAPSQVGRHGGPGKDRLTAGGYPTGNWRPRGYKSTDITWPSTRRTSCATLRCSVPGCCSAGTWASTPSQKLFGKFHGPGLDGVGQVFEKNGLAPGSEMADGRRGDGDHRRRADDHRDRDPAGPLAVAGAMSVAAAHNSEGGLMAARGGVELPVATSRWR